MLDGKIPVPISLKPKMAMQVRERRSGGTGTSLCALLQADANSFLLRAQSQPCTVLARHGPREGATLSLSRMRVRLNCSCAASAWTQISAAKSSTDSRGKTAKWQMRNRARFPDLGSIVQLINHTASSPRTLVTLGKIKKVPGFCCIGCRRKTVSFDTGVQYPLSSKYL